jgi:ketosteroid isomerase-like protein
MRTTTDVIQNHLSSFAAGDLEGLMADYTEDAVLFTPQGKLLGPASIRGFMSSLFAEFAKPGASFRLGTQQVAGEVAYIVWSAETADNRYELGTDTFVVRGGRILQQSFAGKIVPRG